uniref:NEDD4-binding protein 1-like n=1 Tax=Vespula vulgaris TaxID=7454 RepID=UPI00213182FD|nr:NEDD4-binding protein 1-like [Vespula vulgaris]XP_050845279.1 NEDD4-binding protein 1-like [Vespula vulgaris]
MTRKKKNLNTLMKKSSNYKTMIDTKRKASYDRLITLIKESKKCQVKKAKQSEPSQKVSTSLLNDSVIVLSDNENEESEKVKYTTQDNNTEGTVHSTLGQLFKSFQCLRKANEHAISNRIVNSAENNKLRRRSIIECSSFDTSCYEVSDSTNMKSKVLHTSFTNEKSSNNKLNESVDDIVVVWSSINNSSTNKNISNKTDIEEDISDEENQPRLFMLDYDGDPSNLTCLKSAPEEHNKTANNDNDLLFNKPGLQLPHCCKPNFSINVEPQKNMRKISAKFYGKKLNTQHVQPEKVNDAEQNKAKKLREIIIDGCNVAMAHTHGKSFSEAGLKLVIDYFQHRGHSVKAFVPQHKRSLSHPLLEKLWKEGTVVFTPSRNIAGKNITPYDDRFILEYATMCKGIVVSLDQFRDLYTEKPEWRDTIENRLLAPTFVGNYVMFPDDPLGRDGPTLAQFLRHDS